MRRENEPNENKAGDKLDSILSAAKPRPLPSSSRKEAVFDELRVEWLAGQRAMQTKHRYFISTIAASVVLALALILQMNFDAESPSLPPDAVMIRSTGNGILINNRPIESLTPVNAMLRFAKGDTVATGNNASLAIAWKGAGSLRVNSSSAVKLLTHDRIELAAGEIYYDSRSHFASDASAISVVTPLGTVRHVGTQFLAKVDKGSISISVREGQVEFSRDANSMLRISQGESVHIDGTGSPIFSKVGATEESWRWASAIAPYLDVDGRSTHDIIRWISRETGRVVEYANDSAKAYAMADEVRGIGEVDPLKAMAIIPIATELRLDIDNRAIRVGLTD